MLTNSYDQEFNHILASIKQAKQKMYQQANSSFIDLYWQIGKLISDKVKVAQWGKAVVSDLAKYIANNDYTIKGFSDKNLWRMKQFYETYADQEKLSPLVRELPWTHNTIIFSRCKTSEEQEFYLRLTIKEHYSKRNLERQIDASLYERTMIGNQNISETLKIMHPNIENTFKDSYVLEFLSGLPVIG